MEALIERYPDDVEARLLATRRQLLRQYLDNAAANHYWIHAVEGSGHPEWAVESADKLGARWPPRRATWYTCRAHFLQDRRL